jgi:hypothetical protein
MARDKELETGLRRMSEDFYLPGGGRMKLSRLVAEHLGWFDVAERRGMGWRDMIRALTAAGVVGRTGKHLSVGTLSSTIWRERDKTKQEDLAAVRETRPPQRPSIPRAQEDGRRLTHARKSERPLPRQSAPFPAISMSSEQGASIGVARMCLRLWIERELFDSCVYGEPYPS